MSDRFRFRVWDKENKKFLHDLSFDISSNGTLILNCGIEGKKFINLNDNNRYILLQSTGLKDKNGKLIYEGDIIVIPNQYPFYDYKNQEEYQKYPNLNETNGEIKGESILNYIGIVEWIYSQWQYVYHCVNPNKKGISEGINCGINDYGYDENENTEYLVIGNIYENKELLE